MWFGGHTGKFPCAEQYVIVMYLVKSIMKFMFLFLLLLLAQGSQSLGLGTKIFLTDRDIYNAIRQLSVGHGNRLLDNLKLYTSKVKKLIKTVNRPRKRTIQVVACYCNNGCPRFLRLEMPDKETFLKFFNWVDSEYNQFIAYLNKSQHLKEDVFKIYEREKVNYNIKDD